MRASWPRPGADQPGRRVNHPSAARTTRRLTATPVDGSTGCTRLDHLMGRARCAQLLHCGHHGERSYFVWPQKRSGFPEDMLPPATVMRRRILRVAARGKVSGGKLPRMPPIWSGVFGGCQRPSDCSSSEQPVRSPLVASHPTTRSRRSFARALIAADVVSKGRRIMEMSTTTDFIRSASFSIPRF